jgi:NAD(P)-dependent dehydrogenase (short-subunit alcohol dehydrogenase family)
MTKTLITGANKGLGRDTARRLIEAGHDVWISARDETRGKAAAEELGGRFVQLDVTDDASVARAVARISNEGGLDVLVNNAGILGARKKPRAVTAADLRDVFETNLFGVVRVTNAFLPLLEKSHNPVVVNVSSGMGSLGLTRDPERIESKIPSAIYSPSNAAPNMLTSQYAKAFPGCTSTRLTPGQTATDFNGHKGSSPLSRGPR